jgi:PhnB protein
VPDAILLRFHFNEPKEPTMRVNPYLHFSGQCEEAFKFYERVLGGKIGAMITHAGTPAEQHTPKEWCDKIMHARLFVGDDVLMGSDAPPGHYQKPAGYSVALQIKDPVEGKRVFDALAENGTIVMPFAQTFWAAGFGMLVDRFGIPWMVNSGETS